MHTTDCCILDMGSALIPELPDSVVAMYIMPYLVPRDSTPCTCSEDERCKDKGDAFRSITFEDLDQMFQPFRWFVLCSGINRCWRDTIDTCIPDVWAHAFKSLFCCGPRSNPRTNDPRRTVWQLYETATTEWVKRSVFLSFPTALPVPWGREQTNVTRQMSMICCSICQRIRLCLCRHLRRDPNTGNMLSDWESVAALTQLDACDLNGRIVRKSSKQDSLWTWWELRYALRYHTTLFFQVNRETVSDELHSWSVFTDVLLMDRPEIFLEARCSRDMTNLDPLICDIVRDPTLWSEMLLPRASPSVPCNGACEARPGECDYLHHALCRYIDCSTDRDKRLHMASLLWRILQSTDDLERARRIFEIDGRLMLEAGARTTLDDE